MPETLSNVKDTEDFGTVEACCDVLYGGRWVLFPADGLVEVTWVEAYTQLTILLRHDHHGADSWCGLLDRCYNILLHKVV